MFKHVGLTAQEISELGQERAQTARAANQRVTDEVIAADQERKEKRAIKLNSASLDITRRFNEWYRQRRHKIRYDADGDYFRIWVADNRRPDVEIELEARSKGFQWFFSFYLVFLVESEESLGYGSARLHLRQLRPQEQPPGRRSRPQRQSPPPRTLSQHDQRERQSAHRLSHRRPSIDPAVVAQGLVRVN